jgi:hypothetical protein
MLTKGGLNSITRSQAIGYAKEGIRFNAVAPGVVDSPMHKGDSKEILRTFQPMGKIVGVSDVSKPCSTWRERGKEPEKCFTWMVASTLAIGNRGTVQLISAAGVFARVARLRRSIGESVGRHFVIHFFVSGACHSGYARAMAQSCLKVGRLEVIGQEVKMNIPLSD